MTFLRTSLVFLALLGLAACEGLFTGSRELSQPLAQAEDGSYAPIKVQLTPEMNPIALNFRGATVPNITESARWNSYRATLALDGTPVAGGAFDVNNPGAREQEHGAAFATTMFYVSVPRAGEYELRIALTKPREITIEEPRVEIRRNTQPPTVNPPERVQK